MKKGIKLLIVVFLLVSTFVNNVGYDQANAKTKTIKQESEVSENAKTANEVKTESEAAEKAAGSARWFSCSGKYYDKSDGPSSYGDLCTKIYLPPSSSVGISGFIEYQKIKRGVGLGYDLPDHDGGMYPNGTANSDDAHWDYCQSDATCGAGATWSWFTNGARNYDRTGSKKNFYAGWDFADDETGFVGKVQEEDGKIEINIDNKSASFRMPYLLDPTLSSGKILFAMDWNRNGKFEESEILSKTVSSYNPVPIRVSDDVMHSARFKNVEFVWDLAAQIPTEAAKTALKENGTYGRVLITTDTTYNEAKLASGTNLSHAFGEIEDYEFKFSTSKPGFCDAAPDSLLQAQSVYETYQGINYTNIRNPYGPNFDLILRMTDYVEKSYNTQQRGSGGIYVIAGVANFKLSQSGGSVWNTSASNENPNQIPGIRIDIVNSATKQPMSVPLQIKVGDVEEGEVVSYKPNPAEYYKERDSVLQVGAVPFPAVYSIYPGFNGALSPKYASGWDQNRKLAHDEYDNRFDYASGASASLVFNNTSTIEFRGKENISTSKFSNPSCQTSGCPMTESRRVTYDIDISFPSGQAQTGGIDNCTIVTPAKVDADKTVAIAGGGSKAKLGDEVTYTLKTSNTGGTDAKNVVLTDNIRNADYYFSETVGSVPVTIKSNLSADKNTTLGALASGYNYGTLKVGETLTIVYKLTVKSNLTISNDNTFVTNEFAVKYDGGTSDDSALLPIERPAQNITVEKEAVKPSDGSHLAQIVAGESIKYIITVKNHTTNNPFDLNIVDVIDTADQAFVESVSSVVIKNRAGTTLSTITYDQLKAGNQTINLGPVSGDNDTITIEYTIKTDVDAPLTGSNYTLDNTFTFDKSGSLEVSDKESVVIETPPDLEVDYVDISKSIVDEDASQAGHPNANIVNPGEKFTYTIKVKNTSVEKSATSVYIQDYPYYKGGDPVSQQAEGRDLFKQLIKEAATSVPLVITSTAAGGPSLGNGSATTLEQFLTSQVILSELKPGEEVTIKFTVTAKDTISALGQSKIDNEVVAIAGEGITGAAIGQATIPIAPPQPEITKTAITEIKGDQLARRGEIITYAIRVDNRNNNVALANYKVRDKLDKFGLMNFYPGDNIPVTLVYSNGTIESKTSADLKAGIPVNLQANEYVDVTFDLVVPDDIIYTLGGYAMFLQNLAELFDPNGKLIDTDFVQIDFYDIGVDIEKEAYRDAARTIPLDYAEPGQTVYYRVAVTNNGTHNIVNTVTNPKKDIVSNIVITDDLAGIKDYITDATPISKTIDTLKVEETKYHDFSVTLKAAGDSVYDGENLTLVNTAQAKLTVNNRIVEDYASFKVLPDLVRKHVTDANGNGIAEPGEKIEYDIILFNVGREALTDAVVKDNGGMLTQIEEAAADVSVLIQSFDDEYMPNPGSGNNTIIKLSDLVAGKTLANVAFGEVVLITYVVTVKADLDVDLPVNDFMSNKVTFNGEEDTATIPIDKPKLSIVKTVKDANQDDKAEPGEKLDYTVTIENVGTMDALDLFVQDDLALIKDYVNYANADVTITSEIDGVAQPDSINATTTKIENIMSGRYFEKVVQKEKLTITFSLTVKTDAELADGVSFSDISGLKNVVKAGVDEGSVTIPLGGELEFSKTVADSADAESVANPSETLTYTFTVKNSTTAAVQNVVLKDDLAEILSLGTVSEKLTIDGEATTHDTMSLVDGFTIPGTIARDATVTISFTVKLNATLPTDVKIISNIASLTNGDDTYYAGADIPTVGNTDDNSFVAIKSVEDANKDGFATEGEELTYTITLHNKTENAVTVNVKDEPDTNVRYAGTDVVTISNATSKTMTNLVAGFDVALAANETVMVTYKVKVVSPLPTTVTEISNIVTATEEGKTSEKPTVTIPTQPTVGIAKSVVDSGGNDVADTNETLTYTIAVTNNAAGNITVNIQDKLVELAGMYNSAEKLKVNGTDSTSTIANLIAGFDLEVAPGVTNISFTVKVPATIPSNVDNYSNYATVEYNDETIGAGTDIPTTGNTDTNSIVATKEVEDANKDGLASEGEKLTYTITLFNETDAETTINVKDVLDANVTYTATDKLTINGVESTSTMANLVAGFDVVIGGKETVKISYTVTVKSPLPSSVTEIKNTVTVTEDGKTPERPEVVLPTQATLAIEKSVVDSGSDNVADANETLTYTIVVTNNAAKNITVTVQDKLTQLAGMYAATDKLTINGVESTSTIADLIAGFDLAINPGVTNIVFSVKVPATIPAGITNYSNYATVEYGGETKGAGTDIPTTGNTDDNSVVVIKDVEDANKDGLAAEGEEITYTITIFNETDNATTVNVKDTPDANVTYATTDKLTINGVESTSTMANLTAGFDVALEGKETVTITYTVTIISPLPSTVTEIMNLVTVTEDGKVPEKPEVVLPTIPTFEIEKTVVDSGLDNIANAGEELAYAITITNNSVNNITVKVQDKLVEFLDMYSVTDKLTINGTEATTTMGDLVAGFDLNVAPGVTNIEFTVTVPDTIDEQIDDYSNIASVTYGDETKYSGAYIPVESGEVLDIVAIKEVEDANVDGIAVAGEELTYTLTVYNAADVEKVITVTDIPDSNVTFSNSDVVNITNADISTSTMGELTTTGVKVSVKPNDVAIITYIVKVSEIVPLNLEEIVNRATFVDEDGNSNSTQAVISVDSTVNNAVLSGSVMYDGKLTDPRVGVSKAVVKLYRINDKSILDNYEGTMSVTEMLNREKTGTTMLPSDVSQSFLDEFNRRCEDVECFQLVRTGETNSDGEYSFDVPNGYYAVVIQDPTIILGERFKSLYKIYSGKETTGYYLNRSNTRSTRMSGTNSTLLTLAKVVDEPSENHNFVYYRITDDASTSITVNNKETYTLNKVTDSIDYNAKFEIPENINLYSDVKLTVKLDTRLDVKNKVIINDETGEDISHLGTFESKNGEIVFTFKEGVQIPTGTLTIKVNTMIIVTSKDGKTELKSIMEKHIFASSTITYMDETNIINEFESNVAEVNADEDSLTPTGVISYFGIFAILLLILLVLKRKVKKQS